MCIRDSLISSQKIAILAVAHRAVSICNPALSRLVAVSYTHLRYPLYTQTPPYAYFNDCIATPPFGDHKLGNGTEFALYGLYCDQVAQYDSDTAQKMYATWCRANKPVKGFWGESVTLENLMYSSTLQGGANAQASIDLKSCASFPNSGIYVFRDQFGTPQENYLAVMSSPKNIRCV